MCATLFSGRDSREDCDDDVDEEGERLARTRAQDAPHLGHEVKKRPFFSFLSPPFMHGRRGENGLLRDPLVSFTVSMVDAFFFSLFPWAIALQVELLRQQQPHSENLS